MLTIHEYAKKASHRQNHQKPVFERRENIQNIQSIDFVLLDEYKHKKL